MYWRDPVRTYNFPNFTNDTKWELNDKLDKPDCDWLLFPQLAGHWAVIGQPARR